MAEEEPILVSPATPEDARHVHDYTRFAALLKWAAIACFVIAILVLFIIS